MHYISCMLLNWCVPSNRVKEFVASWVEKVLPKKHDFIFTTHTYSKYIWMLLSTFSWLALRSCVWVNYDCHMHLHITNFVISIPVVYTYGHFVTYIFMNCFVFMCVSVLHAPTAYNKLCYCLSKPCNLGGEIVCNIFHCCWVLN